MNPTRIDTEMVAQVRAEMARQDITTPELARRLGIAPATLRARLQSSAGLRMPDLSAIAQALQVPLSELVARAEGRAA